MLTFKVISDLVKARPAYKKTTKTDMKKIWMKEVVKKKLSIDDTPKNKIKLQGIIVKGLKAPAKKTPAKKVVKKKVKIDFDDIYGGGGPPGGEYINDWSQESGSSFAKVRAQVRRYLKEYNKSDNPTIAGAYSYIKKMEAGK
jgi:hypothetical protein